MNVVEHFSGEVPEGSKYEALKSRLESISAKQLQSQGGERQPVENVHLHLARVSGNHGDITKAVFAVHGEDAVFLGTVTESGGHARSYPQQGGSAANRHLTALAERFVAYQKEHPAEVRNGHNHTHEAPEGSKAAKLLAKWGGNGNGRGNGRH